MAKAVKLSMSEVDGVNYRRAKLWQIVLIACNALNGMAIYSLVGYASYAASIGFGIATLAVGGILTFTRIFDAITDPILAFIYDRFNTRWGKVRPLILIGWAIQSVGLLAMFSWFGGKGLGVVGFIVFYMIYVTGYTIVNMTVQTLPALMTNDPKQRPTIGVWQTAFNYVVPMVLSIVLSMVLLPKFGGEYNEAFLSAAGYICVFMSLVGVLLVCIGISAYDKPENFKGLEKNEKRLKPRDMIDVLRNNKPLGAYIISAASDKIAQQAASTSIVNTLLLGILIGDMGLGTILSVIGMFPSIVFAIFGARYAGKHGNKESIVTWSRNSIFAAVFAIVFFIIIDPSTISAFGVTMILYVVITLVINGFMMCITTANSAFMADIIDFELDRSGRYVPAVVTGTYSLIDKIVSSVSALVATGCVALIGYTATLPQPEDPATTGVFWVTMFLKYGLAILGWVCTLIAMRGCKLGKAEMVEVQKRIAAAKEEAQVEFFDKELNKAGDVDA